MSLQMIHVWITLALIAGVSAFLEAFYPITPISAAVIFENDHDGDIFPHSAAYLETLWLALSFLVWVLAVCSALYILYLVWYYVIWECLNFPPIGRRMVTLFEWIHWSTVADKFRLEQVERMEIKKREQVEEIQGRLQNCRRLAAAHHAGGLFTRLGDEDSMELEFLPAYNTLSGDHSDMV